MQKLEDMLKAAGLEAGVAVPVVVVGEGIEDAALCVRWTDDPGAVAAIPQAARLVPLPSPPERFKNLWDELKMFNKYTQAHLVLDGDRLGLAAPRACDAASHQLCTEFLRDCEADARAYAGEHDDAAPRPQAEDEPGRKPCDSRAALPCLGSEGTCFARPYWDLKTFDDKNIRRQAADLAACPSEERVERYIVEEPWNRAGGGR